MLLSVIVPPGLKLGSMGREVGSRAWLVMLVDFFL
jgi:hypothetical protein